MKGVLIANLSTAYRMKVKAILTRDAPEILPGWCFECHTSVLLFGFTLTGKASERVLWWFFFLLLVTLTT